MTYIILNAGIGKNLQPLTLKYTKSSFKLDENTTVLQRMVRSIKKHDSSAEIVVVTGYKADNVKNELLNENVKFVINPFYEVTNSIASIWFARQYLERENVAIVHGDVVFDEKIIKNYLTVPTDFPYVLVDSAINEPGAYNIIGENNKVFVMSKKLDKYIGKYCCLTKLDPVSSRLVKEEIDSMICDNMYNQYFEDSLVQMIMFKDFELKYVDIKGENWSEVDDVNDLIDAQNIHRGTKL